MSSRILLYFFYFLIQIFCSVVSATSVLRAESSLQPTGPMRFWTAWRGGNCAECEWIAAEGTIVSDTPKIAEEFLKANPFQIVYLNSPGGNLQAGMELGRLFRKRSIHVVVGHTPPPTESDSSATYPEEGRCVSACSYAFLGGVTRNAEKNEIGIHQFSWQLNNFALEPKKSVQNAIGSGAGFALSSAQKVAGYLIAYVQEMGVDPQFVSVASSTEEVHYLSEQELTNFRVSWEAEAFGPWQIRPWGKGIYAFAERSDKKQTIFVYCNSDKKPRLRVQGIKLSAEGEGASDSSLIESALGAQVDLVKTSRLKNGDGVLDMSLVDFEPRNLNGKSDYDISIHAAYHSLDEMFSFKLSAKEAAPAISAAMHNCN